MSKLLRGIAAGVGANYLSKRMGCGCFGTILIFFLLWMLLGQFNIFR